MSQQFTFGSGFLFGTRTDIATQTPQFFGTIQDVSVEFSSSSKELYGPYQFPVAVARGKSKITCKAKLGLLSGLLFNSLFFGGTMVAGEVLTAVSEAGAVPGTSTYTVTVSNSAHFTTDLGVYYLSTGLPLKLVASGPTAGQYSVSAGVYTFAAADANANVLISYQYTNSSAGQKLTLTNPPLGSNPVFSASLFTQATLQSGVKNATLNLHSCVSDKVSFSTKLDDWMIPEFDFAAFADASNTVFDWSFSDVT